ncbi:hypothetical protein [uncultured Pseudokineococcus sp.]|uniref:hypothetical protein n=1 Tax=uncultured Pseudokineococcus sp. TaxID=1642928 RepID=UPI00263763D4|nr:hypothetical protein [uncultured Pseudokineococcus sp.]
MDDDREALLARYRELVLHELPRRGRDEGWAVSVDHCVGRVVLDNALEGPWREVLPPGRGPAYARLPPPALTRAVALAEQMEAEGADLVAELDARSLAWRGKAPKRPPAAPGA